MSILGQLRVVLASWPLVALLGASGRISRGTVPRRDSPRNLVGEESRVADRDSTTHRAFFEYYASESQRDQIVERFVTARDLVLRALKEKGDSLDVADLGCGAGTRSMVWSQLEHRVHGLDTSEELIALGQERADRADLKIDFRVGTVTDLPWEDENMDVCLSIQLLEHVADWSRMPRRMRTRAPERRSPVLDHHQLPVSEPAGVRSAAVQLVSERREASQLRRRGFECRVASI